MELVISVIVNFAKGAALAVLAFTLVWLLAMGLRALLHWARAGHWPHDTGFPSTWPPGKRQRPEPKPSQGDKSHG